MPQNVPVPTDDELNQVLQTLARSVMETFGDDTPDQTKVDIKMANGSASIEVNYKGVNKKLKEDARTLFKRVEIERRKNKRENRQEEDREKTEVSKGNLSDKLANHF